MRRDLGLDAYVRKGVTAIVSNLLKWTLRRPLTGSQKRDAHARAPSLEGARMT